VLAELRGVMRVAPGDEVQKFLLLTSTHDGTGAVRVLFTPVRVVCQNTLSQALRGGGGLSVAHTPTLRAGLEQARGVMRTAIARYRDMEAAFQRMAHYQMDQARLAGYLRAVFPDPPAGDEETRERAARLAADRRAWAGALFEAGAGNDRQPVRGTLWAAYNGVTELVDHDAARIAKGKQGLAPAPGASRVLPPVSAIRSTSRLTAGERRLQSVWFGDGARLKARAYEEAVGLLTT